MLKAQIAEWILSLFSTRELAASTVGDWLEEVSARGSFWFWSNVLRTTLSFAWRGISSAPLGLAGIAFRAWMLSQVFFFGLYTLILCATYVPLIVVSLLSHGQDVGLPEWAPTAVFSVVYFQIGRWIGRRAGNRAITVCVLFEVLSNTIRWILWHALARSAHLAEGDTNYASILFVFSWVIAGAIWVRRHESIAVKVI
jgi:hypothetical protein